MDDDGSGGVGKFERFDQTRAGRRGNGQISSYRVASADDVYGTMHRQGGHVMYLAIRRDCHYAAFSQCDENGTVISLRHFLSCALDLRKAAVSLYSGEGY